MRDVTAKKICRGFGLKPVMAAVIYMACRMEGVPRTQKEICSPLNVDVRAVNRIFVKISKSLNINNASLRILPKNLIPRLCSQLRLTSIVSDCIAICENVAEMGVLDGNSPAVAAAAVIKFVCEINKVDVDFDRICTLVCEKSIIKVAYQKLVPYTESLVPSPSSKADFVEGTI